MSNLGQSPSPDFVVWACSFDRFDTGGRESACQVNIPANVDTFPSLKSRS